MKAHRNIASWTPAKKSLAENLRAYKSLIHSYRYVVRYALTHGVKRREFNNRPQEATLVQDFCAKINKSQVRIRMQKISDIENVAVLEIVCQQIDSEDCDPLGYKSQTTKASIYLMGSSDTEIAESDIELIEDEFAIDSQEEIFYVNFDGRRRPARWNNSRGRSFGRNRNYRSYNPNYPSNTRFQRPKRSIYPNTRDSVERRWGSDDVCPECVMPGHKRRLPYSKEEIGLRRMAPGSSQGIYQ
ncbi:MAG: hypothetical protein GY928_37775 [Colwellia sp.]|nr:hypothetical protein [Colwellia sp.]